MRILMRTSLTHPLQIARIPTRENFGCIGVTFCPGKKQPSAMSGGWMRDLEVDLDSVRDFDAAALVSLIEQHEMDALQVSALGEETQRRHIDWLHLPIRDVSVPRQEFEEAWHVHGPGLCARLRDGFNVVVHCKGGLGRAGTIAARLLVELGIEPEVAIARVRTHRPGAIETSAQAAYVRRQKIADEPQPSTDPLAVADRAAGALLGLATGDALGTTLEFTQRDARPPLTTIVGGGPFRLKPGEWTDDTAMALALATSLLERGGFDAADLMRRFTDWRLHGTYSCTGTCFDIGLTVSAALRRWERTGEPYAGSRAADTAGNGSLMRLAPVAIRYWNDPAEARRVAASQSRTTHAAPEAVNACTAYAELIAEAISGKPREHVLRNRSGAYAPNVGRILSGSWRGKPRAAVASSGYVVHSLEAALWSIGRTADFRSAVLTAANLAGDADTTAAITGQLAGALYGRSGIPPEWLEKLAWRKELEGVALALHDCEG